MTMYPNNPFEPDIPLTIPPEVIAQMISNVMSPGRLASLSEGFTVKGNDPLFPVDERRDERNRVVQNANQGVRVRTYIATKIMASIASDPEFDLGADEAANTAVVWADALIKRLNQ